MWGWITGAIGRVAGVIDDNVRRWVGDLISGVFGFMHTIFGFVGNAWNDMWRAGNEIYQSVSRFASEVAAVVYHLYRVWLPFIVHWAWKEILSVLHFARGVLHWAAHEFDVVRHWVAALINATRAWVVRDIWDPIWRTLAPAWKWVTHEGSTLWHYLTHLAAFIDLIWNYLLVKMEHEAWTAGRLLGRFFLSLVIHNVKTFAVLIEDIVDAIL